MINPSSEARALRADLEHPLRWAIWPIVCDLSGQHGNSSIGAVRMSSDLLAIPSSVRMPKPFAAGIASMVMYFIGIGVFAVNAAADAAEVVATAVLTSPYLLLFWRVTRVRVDLGNRGIRVVNLFKSQELGWNEISGFSFNHVRGYGMIGHVEVTNGTHLPIHTLSSRKWMIRQGWDRPARLVEQLNELHRRVMQEPPTRP